MAKETALTTNEKPLEADYLHKLMNGDIGALTPEEQRDYYLKRCASLGLDPMSQPFLFLVTPGRVDQHSGVKEEDKTSLYATRSATDQLGKVYALTEQIVKVEVFGDVVVIQTRVTGKDGRSVDNIGAAGLGKYGGNSAANAYKKAVTQSYRRAVIQYCGLGMVDESEIEDIQNARTYAPTFTVEEVKPQLNPHNANPATGEIPVEDRPAGQQRVTRLLEVAKELFDLTGESVDIPDAPTVAECNRLGREVQVKLTAAKAERAARIDTAQSLAGVP